LETQRLQNRPQRVIICKARKLGMSTWIQAKILQRCTQLPFQNALTVCHRADATVDLADMASLMYDKLPDDRALTELVYGPTGTTRPPFSVKPGLLATGTSRNGIRFMEFGTKHRRSEHSIYRTMTAGAKGGGRAGTPNMVHASEYAHYEDPDYGVGLFNAMPLEPDTLGIIESTANGFNHFWKLWDMAVRGAEDETGALWQPLFYGWHDNPRNALAFINDHARERFEHTIGDEDGGGDLEEPLLIENYGATLEQLNWRRALINGPEANGSDRVVPSGASDDPGASVRRIRPARVPRHPCRPRAPRSRRGAETGGGCSPRPGMDGASHARGYGERPAARIVGPRQPHGTRRR
jgi:hypothetical protein